MTVTIGLLLAAGAGKRMGMPKALVRGANGVPWVVSASRVLLAGGCRETVVVVGAEAAKVGRLLADEPVTVVTAPDWESGMGASLRAGLRAVADSHAEAALVHLVDLPDVGPEVVRRLIDRAAPDVLARARYGALPGHPVLLGSNHWSAVADECAGDSGARAYLARHEVAEVDCADLATGADVDRRGPATASDTMTARTEADVRAGR